mgnify:CR=1 FL=1
MCGGSEGGTGSAACEAAVASLPRGTRGACTGRCEDGAAVSVQSSVRPLPPGRSLPPSPHPMGEDLGATTSPSPLAPALPPHACPDCALGPSQRGDAEPSSMVPATHVDNLPRPAWHGMPQSPGTVQPARYERRHHRRPVVQDPSNDSGTELWDHVSDQRPHMPSLARLTKARVPGTAS